MRLMGKRNNSATRLWTDEDVETRFHTTKTATNHSTIAYVTINNPILTNPTLINPTHISHTLPNPAPTRPAHSPLTDAVQPMFRLTNHGGPIRQSCIVTTRGVSETTRGTLLTRIECPVATPLSLTSSVPYWVDGIFDKKKFYSIEASHPCIHLTYLI